MQRFLAKSFASPPKARGLPRADRERPVLAGLGFAGHFLDIDLYHRVTTSTPKWARLERKTYHYHFGRTEQSNTVRMLERAGLGSGKAEASPRMNRGRDWDRGLG